eukprot:TRINITY_DN4031_c0_g1_i1.p1 TRINITY_DN4031_c0_g1~~TRINITY_DN4031_c0_g1_i1.p1  ORF type:complete len:365 (-),score=88.68 TRINITY_DN4031_c0_g1_i1:39-1133(-)
MEYYELNEIDPDDDAVILYTSGSESAPKGVPLSHANILANVDGVTEIAELSKDDIVLAILPPFHSFGFTVTSILPLCVGCKVCFYPNPTDRRGITNTIAKWKPTIFLGTPTFLEGVLVNLSNPEKVSSLRLCVTGAEKCPDDLFDLVDELGISDGICEGYGITECGPVLSVNRPGVPRCGVGHPMSGVSIRIVDINDPSIEKPNGETGLIIAQGPNIFAGYLKLPEKYPFVEFEGEQWYNTGDLGHLNQDLALTIDGRLKRFVKVGGEMVSLPALENCISQLLVDEEDGVAVEAIEIPGERPYICVLSKSGITKEAAAEALKEAGFGAICFPNMHKQVDEIPMLGSGKRDYRTMKDIVSNMITS